VPIVVATLVGGVCAAVMLATSLVMPQPLPMLIGLATGILLTGAFHEDGLADAADGLFGGLTRERRLEIMKDSRIGTYGVLALMIALGLKATSLSIVDPITAVPVLVAAHAGGRLATVFAIYLMPYAGDEQAAKVKPLATGLSGGEMIVATLLGLTTGLICLSPAVLALSALLGCAAAGALALVSKRLIGGYTGDILGAMEQCFETLFMVAAVTIIAGPN
jgi:adenosylcobinamide-GDP ribazoletransferase